MIDPVEQLGAVLRRAQEDPQAEAVDLQRLQIRLAASLREPPRSRAWLLVPGIAAVAVLLFVLLPWRQGVETPSLTYQLGDDAPSSEVGRVISAVAGETRALRFSEGSSVVVQPESRLRIAALAKQGAALRLEGGQASLQVRHRDDTHWKVEAGPFVVEVVGTSFDVEWDAASSTFGLRMHEGSVEVSGPVIGERRVHGGDVLRVDVRASGGQVVMGTAGQRVEPESVQPESPKPESVKEPQAMAPATRPVSAPRVSFESLAQEGRYTEALSAARAAGWDKTLRESSATALMTLGDAARFSGDFDAAVQGYTAVRERFLGSRHGAQAALALGRLEFDQRHHPKEAAQWFARYIDEAPDGTVVIEATGRLMEAELASGDRARAQATARRYLERYPSGAHAALAKSLVGTPP